METLSRLGEKNRILLGFVPGYTGQKRNKYVDDFAWQRANYLFFEPDEMLDNFLSYFRD